MKKSKPIVILGAPRSGTSILGDILSKHPDVHYLVEPTPLWRKYAKFRGDFVASDYTSKQVLKTRQVFEQSHLNSGKKTILEKTPQNCLRVPFVYDVFPNAKYIHIVRDGYESSLSIMKHWQAYTTGFTGVRIGQRLKELSLSQIPKYGIQFIKRLMPSRGKPRVYWGPVLPGMSKMLDAFSIAEISAIQWKICVEQACHFGRKLPKGQYMEVRLEDLTSAKLKEIIEFTELPASDEVHEAFLQKFNSKQTSYRKSGANKKVLASMEPWLSPTMSWLGQRDTDD
ncbi:sulfotransferase family protein [Rubritalea profundi]|uniref:Sulfotransferase domain-containing protein n=1 Tax=Rubritalea profundi TaxID=1658618 RepID=A0A2S7TZ70_9BACT|nr:sulfotransferase [Rubritalea profundi]PQJ28055.1 hypothetical protein BSZ32_05765 [Rubritalea profundi]